MKSHININLGSWFIELHQRLRLQRFQRRQRDVASPSALRSAAARPRQLMLRLSALLCLGVTQQLFALEPLATWTPRTSPYGTTNNWRAVAFGNGKFVAVNQNAGLVITSTNGTDWIPHSANTNKSLYGLAFGNNKFVAAGASGLIMTSSDGVSWQPQPSGTVAHLYHVNYDNGQFVAVGDSGTILSSPNGTTWTSRNTGNTNKWNASAYGNGTNVVVGYRTQGGTSYTRSAAAPNFTNWDVRDTGGTFYLSGVAFGAGRFVTVGYSGRTQTSADGANWNSVTNATSAWLYEVAFANNTFLAIGENVIVSSTNGTSWQSRYAQSGKTLQGLAFGANTWVVVGNNGLILQSDPVTASNDPLTLSEAKRIGSTFSFKFNGVIGQTYQIQASTNLVNWSNVGTVSCTNSPTSCSLTGQNGPGRFYRVLKM